MATPTVFKNGVSTAETGVFKSLPFLNPTDYYSYFNDFMAPTDWNVSDWTVTKVEAGSGSAAYTTVDYAGGALKILNDDADNDSVSAQLVKKSFFLTAGKKTFFEALLQVDDATQSDLLIGLVITDTDPLTGFTDGIAFIKPDGATSVNFSSLKNSAGTTGSAVTTLTSSVPAKLGFFFDGTNIFVYKDGAQVAYYPSATIVDDEQLALTIHFQNGEAVAKSCYIDYIFVAQER